MWALEGTGFPQAIFILSECCVPAFLAACIPEDMRDWEHRDWLVLNTWEGF